MSILRILSHYKTEPPECLLTPWPPDDDLCDYGVLHSCQHLLNRQHFGMFENCMEILTREANARYQTSSVFSTVTDVEVVPTVSY